MKASRLANTRAKRSKWAPQPSLRDALPTLCLLCRSAKQYFHVGTKLCAKYKPVKCLVLRAISLSGVCSFSELLQCFLDSLCINLQNRADLILRHTCLCHFLMASTRPSTRPFASPSSNPSLLAVLSSLLRFLSSYISS